MTVERGGMSVLVLVAVMLPLITFLGCGDSGEGPAAPELGEEVDVSMYLPASFQDYAATYSIDRGRGTIEACVKYHGAETIYDLNPDTGQQTEVECCILEVDAEWGNQPDVRVYRCENYEYGIRTCVAGQWGQMYYYIPKRCVLPDENPRIGSTFDSKTSSLVTRFTLYETQYRQVDSYRTWVTYSAIEESLTVPAGTFHDVLRTRVRQRIHTKQSLVADTTNVVFDDSNELTYDFWDAPGVGTIKVVGVDTPFQYEKVLMSATADGVEYPVK
jgi:hypothetical protein